MKKTYPGFLLASALLAVTSFAQAGDVIKVVTPDGRVSYTDQKPAKLPSGAKQVLIKRFGEEGVAEPAAKGPSKDTVKEAKDSKDASGQPAIPVTNEEVAKANAEIRKKNDEEKAKIDAENCNILKKNLESYNQGRVVTVKPNGERAYLTDEEVAKGKARDEQALKTTCK